MSDAGEVVRDSGVRTYARESVWHAVRRGWVLRGVVDRGSGIFVERNVRLLRHPERIRLGSNVMLKEGARLCPTNPTASIEVGDWTTVGHHTFVFATDRVSIGASCLIAPFCYFIDSEHGTSAGVLIREQPMSAREVVIGDGVWLGVGVVVTKGVTIGHGAVIGARSVVVNDVPPNAVAVGLPARVVKYREGDCGE